MLHQNVYITVQNYSYGFYNCVSVQLQLIVLIVFIFWGNIFQYGITADM